MRALVVKYLANSQTMQALVEAEEALLDERQPSFEIEGEDESEQLMHVFASIFVLRHMREHGSEFNEALRVYNRKTQLVLD